MSGNTGKKLCQHLREQEVPSETSFHNQSGLIQGRCCPALGRGSAAQTSLSRTNREKEAENLTHIHSKMFSNSLSSTSSRLSSVNAFSCMWRGPFSSAPMLSQGSWQACSGSSSLCYGFDVDASKVHTEDFKNAEINWKQLTQFALHSCMDKL